MIPTLAIVKKLIMPYVILQYYQGPFKSSSMNMQGASGLNFKKKAVVNILHLEGISASDVVFLSAWRHLIAW